MKFKLLISILFFLASSTAYSQALFHYCTGQVTDIVTRGSLDNTQIRIAGMEGWPRIGFGGEEFEDMHERQFSMLLSAYRANEPVTLEFLNTASIISCADDHNGHLIRFVHLKK